MYGPMKLSLYSKWQQIDIAVSDVVIIPCQFLTLLPLSTSDLPHFKTIYIATNTYEQGLSSVRDCYVNGMAGVRQPK